MNCGETREILFAFLDSELDAPLSIEVQRHLERCAACAREAEIERTIRKGLLRELHSVGGDRAADERELERAVRRLANVPGVRRKWRRPQFVGVSSAALLALVAAGWVWRQSEQTAHGSERLADMLVNDFVHFQEKGSPLEFESNDREAVSSWLRAKTQLAVVLPAMDGDQCRLIGARKCVLGGRPTAFAFYEIHGAPVALAVLASEPGDEDGMQEIRSTGGEHWVDRCKGHTVVTCRRDKLAYAAVSREASEAQLISLMTGGIHESN